MSLPNFIIVGASKAGTSSVWNYLNEHPDIFLPKPKEPLFFIKDIYNQFNDDDPGYSEVKDRIIQNIEDYSSLFENTNRYKAIGEASASYLYYSQEASANILKTLGPKTKIIIILRNPVDKIISHYKFYRLKGFEKQGFNKALDNENTRVKNNYNPFYHYRRQGFYYENVKCFIDNFNDVHICFYEDLKANSQLFLDEIFLFLRVDKINVESSNLIHNKSYVPKHSFINSIFDRIGKDTKSLRKHINIDWKKIRNNLNKINEDKYIIDTEKYNELMKEYVDDIDKLEKLLKIDLKTKWNIEF